MGIAKIRRDEGARPLRATRRTLRRIREPYMNTKMPRMLAPPAIPMNAYSVCSSCVLNYLVSLHSRREWIVHTFIPKNPAMRAPVPTPNVAIDTLISSAKRALRPESSINSAISCVDCIFAYMVSAIFRVERGDVRRWYRPRIRFPPLA